MTLPRIIPLTLFRLGLCVLFFAGPLMLLSGCETHPGAGQWNQPGDRQEPAFDIMGQTASAPPPGAELMPAIIGPPPDPSFEDLIYHIGPYDDLKVEVFGVPELSTEAQVNLQGLIALPLLGPVEVNGLTPREAEEEIKRQLASRYMRDPRVIVYVKNSASLNVTITGAVGSQGVQPIRGRKTLTDILAQAGGVTPLGKEHQVVLYRGEGPAGMASEGKMRAYVIDYQQILDGKMRDPLVVGDDRIYVPSSGLAIFFSPLVNILQTWALPAARGGY
ncbi:MAG: polysaccharide biosynthesis/export family protein [Chromatiaceae bacterium]